MAYLRKHHVYPERRYDMVHAYKTLHRFNETTVDWMASRFLGEETGEKRGGAVTQKQKMEIFLRHLADPGFQSGVGEDKGFSQPTISRIFHEVVDAIHEKADHHITFPCTLEEMERAHVRWTVGSSFPYAIGAIDCTHVKVMAPRNALHPDEYVNRKGFHSFNVQVTCDSGARATSVVAEWPGSVHDSRILKNSPVPRVMNGKDALLLGDSGYGIRPWLMTPYRVPGNEMQRNFNRIFTKERVVIERLFGIVKRRFPLIGGVVRLKTETVPKVITACFVLHNISLDFNDTMIFDDDNGEEEQEALHQEEEDLAEVAEAALRHQGQQRRNEIAEALY